MKRSDIERVIKESYAARQDEDVEAVLGYFTKDATFRMSVGDGFGDYSRTIRGHEELRAMFTALFRIWDWRNFRIDELVIDEGGSPIRAAVHLAGRVRHAPTGREFDFETLDLLSFRDARIARFIEFFDTNTLAQFASASEVLVAPSA